MINESQLHPHAGEQIKFDAREFVWRTVELDDYLIDFNRLSGAVTPWLMTDHKLN